jgi:hypothetical protein
MIILTIKTLLKPKFLDCFSLVVALKISEIKEIEKIIVVGVLLIIIYFKFIERKKTEMEKKQM